MTKQNGKQRSSRRGGGEATSATSGEEDEVLQAVIIAESFNQRFTPFTKDMPRALIPLVNIPMIEYSLECLAVSGVQQVFVYCRSHAKKLKEYLKTSRWAASHGVTRGGKATGSAAGGMRVDTFVSHHCMSVGDVLRSLDGKGLIDSSFILMNGDLVSNMRLDHILEEHRKRLRLDKNTLMTMVLAEAPPDHPTRERCEGGVFAIDPSNSEIVHYEPVRSERTRKPISTNSAGMAARLSGSQGSLRKVGASNLPTTAGCFTLDTNLFKKRQNMEVRFDLIDCHVDICTPQVLALMTENFDYADMRADFCHGVLTSELLDSTLYAHILRDAYAARARSTHLYDAISRDIISRWVYPIVPDMNPSGLTRYTYQRNFIYKDEGVILARSSRIGPHVVIGAGTAVGEQSVIEGGSVIGPNCRIGDHVHVRGAYLWEGVVVGDHVKIEQSVVGSGVTILPHVTMERGCMVGNGVQVGPEIRLPAFKHIARTPFVPADEEADERSDSEEEEGSTNTSERGSEAGDGVMMGIYDVNVVGAEGRGFQWPSYIDSDDDDDETDEEDAEDTDEKEGNVGEDAGNDEEDGPVLDTLMLPKSATTAATQRRARYLFKHTKQERRQAFTMASDYHTLSEDVKALLLDEGDDSALSDATDDSYMSDMGSEADALDNHETAFHREAQDMARHALAQGYDADTMNIEISALKLACNVSFYECRQAVVPIILAQALTAAPVPNNEPAVPDVAAWISKEFRRLTSWIKKFLHVEEGLGYDIMDMILASCREHQVMRPHFHLFFPVLYDTDLMDEDAILHWYHTKKARLAANSPAMLGAASIEGSPATTPQKPSGGMAHSVTSPTMLSASVGMMATSPHFYGMRAMQTAPEDRELDKALLAQLQKFIYWLETAEEETSEDSSSDDDDDDDAESDEESD